ncbi:hypothetical protein, partial [Sphingomonas sp. DT-204]|uniref:hypothetical protein n=1 Tax=Sphingomonas sp. DT-204 TaxID=3396166 RepID=UPI003F19EB27
RLVSREDANGHRTRLSLIAGTGYDGSEALVASEFDAGGGKVVRGYDVYGTLRKVTDANGLVTSMAYDALGRLTDQINPGGLGDYYAYDVLGQRIRHWNSVLGVGDAETTDYDLQGRIVRARAFGGDVTTTSYAWDAGIGVAALGTAGGWVETTGYYEPAPAQAGGAGTLVRASAETSDVFGHVVSRTDLGGHVFASSYDQAGRLTGVSGNGASTS